MEKQFNLDDIIEDLTAVEPLLLNYEKSTKCARRIFTNFTNKASSKSGGTLSTGQAFTKSSLIVNKFCWYDSQEYHNATSRNQKVLKPISQIETTLACGRAGATDIKLFILQVFSENKLFCLSKSIRRIALFHPLRLPCRRPGLFLSVGKILFFHGCPKGSSFQPTAVGLSENLA
jgi:hypothetical protein